MLKTFKKLIQVNEGKIQDVVSQDFKNFVIHILQIKFLLRNQRTNGPVNAHLICWPSKAQNIQNLENIW